MQPINCLKKQIPSLFFTNEGKTLPLNWFTIRALQKEALQRGVPLEKETIIDICENITKTCYLRFEIDIKLNKYLSTTLHTNIYKYKKDDNEKIGEVEEALSKLAKKETLQIKDVEKLISNKGLIYKSLTPLLDFAKNSNNTSISEIATTWLSAKEYAKELIRIYADEKKNCKDLNPEEFKWLLKYDINTEKFYATQKMLKTQDLEMPKHLIIEFLDKNYNIVTIIKILSEAKQNCIKTLMNETAFNEEEIKELANNYVIWGEENFKELLTEELLKNQLFINPEELYKKLFKSDNYGFKLNLETIKKYLEPELKLDNETIIKVYLRAIDNKIAVKYSQLADMTTQGIDIENFIDLQINSNKDE